MFLLKFFALLLAATAAQAILPIQQWQTSSGAKVYFVQNRDIPMLDLSIDFTAGSGMDGTQKPGVASMTNRIMRLGAEGMDEDDDMDTSSDDDDTPLRKRFKSTSR
jgi:zinc protease